MTAEKEAAYKDALSDALEAGYKVLATRRFSVKCCGTSCYFA
jgi:hypothetical protein